ncbi:immunity protein Imm33 domain-containing protein, partial [Faecalibacterium prausnitzii]|uniref:immunity protein Imm33 domain-containing protein n=1 Tax=Faecalibacterium prausnitzii TaxID=853 RepID=UPI003D7678AA
MYIKKYWGNFIGGSDDSLNLVAFLEDQKKEEIPLSEIFAKIGLDKQNWNFHQTVEYLEFTHSDGVEMDFHFAIDVVTDLAAILLECSVSGSVNLQDLDEYNTSSRRIRITATPEEHDAMDKALADFVHAPLEYDISEMMGEDEITDMASQVEMLRKELYEASGRNRNYHVKAEDVKDLLPDWKGADGCIATNRITVEGCKVGYCYREEPDGGWDSGWRFTAGDESDEYMDDPNNAGIYKLNTICNDDPDIIPLLNTPAPCAFERDENGVFQQIKDWKPDEDEEDPDMDILKQCQKWHEEDKHQKIVDALEAISAEERTPEMDMELARAYNNLADSSEPEGRKLLHQALELMQSHEEELGDTYSWNFRMGYAYYYLDQEGRALRHFEKALELHPGDDPKLNTRQDMEELIDSCKKGISLPQFWECFRERTENCWETFAEMEAELRQMMDEDKDHTRGAELVAQMEGALNQAFDEISFEMGFNGEKHELILTPEGDKVKLFELIYFQKHAPKEVLEHWNILVGRQPLQNIGLRTENGLDISGDDVQIWLEEQGENSFAISAYCEKLLPMLRDEEGRAWWMLTTFTDQVLGEIPHMRYIDSFDVLEEPKAEPSFLLSQLPDKLREQGLELSTDPEAYLESYLGYKMEPKQDPDADWRLDVMAGSTCCVPLINGYLNADNDFMDDLHADGAVAGFFCYPLDTLREEEGSQKIFDFRDKLEEVLTGGDGSEVLTLTGGATGLYCGYVDFIAWDIQEALNMAKEFFEGTDIPWAIFHTFRREAGSVPLKQQDAGSETENQDDELDEALTGMDYIPYTQQNAEAFFAQLEQWNDEDEYTRCIQALNAIPEDWRNYRTAYALARALENYAIIGDHNEGTPRYKGDKALCRAIEVLESVREEGQDKAEWNMRMAYGYQYLYGQEEKAIPYAQRWAELDPEDENASAVIQECKAEIRKRQRSRKKAKFVPGDTPFEGFDLTNFWDDSMYALKEYVSDPPSDELIASVEEELGYKLPAAYIWLMKQHNGGIPVNTCYPCDEPTCWAEDHVAITGIFGIGREKSCSLCGELGSQFMIDEWEYPAIGVAICDCPSAGHDMIFLDYRVCGPQGEPAVVHVDQENDYKITHLADSFEEFIRGLEHESLYDPDEDVEDLEDDADEEETDHKGSFAGSVLLSKAEWDKEQLIRDLREEWGIVDEEPDEGDEDVENSDDAVVMRVGNMMLIVTLFHGHIPDNEAEINAENNYMWPEAVEVAKAHKAHIMVAVLGEEEKLLERGKLFTKAMAVCCKQKYATGVYTSGVVFEPRFYEGLADMIKEDELPIFNWVWFGLYRSEGGLNGYTYGMDVFGKEEMEVLNTDAEPEELRDFLASLASYVLACDVTLQDGETIGFSADDKHTITRSPGVSLPEEQMTLKIGYEPIKGDPEDDDDSIGMDDVSYHIESIEEKELPIDPINAYNHMAIYLRWCMEHDLMGGKFLAEHGEVVNQVKADPGNTDLRTFIREELFGCLFSALFNQKGRAFAHYYYGENDAPYYPADIDDYALKYFGPSRYHSNEFQQEAYLFIPFDEKYYQAMAEVIEERFENWQGQDFDEDTLEPSEVAHAIMEYLDCECTYFPSMADDDPIMSAYSYAQRLGVREGFVPVLIQADDETLLECLVMNADSEHDADFYEFDLKTVTEYRKKVLSAPVKDGKAILEELTGQRKEEAEDDDLDWDEEVLDEMEGGEPNDRFANYWNDGTGMTYPLILAKIPVKNPWEIFAYLPFGNWNECPDTPDLMAVA